MLPGYLKNTLKSVKKITGVQRKYRYDTYFQENITHNIAMALILFSWIFSLVLKIKIKVQLLHSNSTSWVSKEAVNKNAVSIFHIRTLNKLKVPICQCSTLNTPPSQG